jgi:DNA processing protein
MHPTLDHTHFRIEMLVSYTAAHCHLIKSRLLTRYVSPRHLDSTMSDAASCESLTEDIRETLRLHLVNGVGPVIQERLLTTYGSASRVLSASIAELQQVEGVGPKLAQSISAAKTSDEADREWQRCQESGYQILIRNAPEYPQNLSEIPDAPPLLYCRGSLLPRDQLAIAVVGSRRCSIYGTQQAEKLSAALARAGVTIISGLARGIDAAAHRGALSVGGRTLAISATGIANIYPDEHKELAEQIANNGAILSEFRLDQHPSPGLFPQRNRIISGLSLGVLIIEATRNSGSLHTARHAIEQGREVMALPGRIDSLASEGCHDLIRDGATLIRHADDVLAALGPLMRPIKTADDEEVRSPRELSLNDQERTVLNLITNELQHLDEILRSTALDASRVLATITVLEMKRLVRRMPGGYFVRSPF